MKYVAPFLLAAFLLLGSHPAHASQALDRETVRNIVCQAQYHWDCEWALTTTWNESNYIPDAVNPKSGARCLFQIMPAHMYDAGLPVEWLDDPFFCTDFAYGLYLQYGVRPWQ